MYTIKSHSPHYRPRAIGLLLWISILVLAAACAPTPGKVSQTKAVPELYTTNGLALDGYDPVAYFSDGQPVQGVVGNEIEWHGVRWRFSTAEHATAFVKDPEHYAPQFGGYCAFAVSRGTTASGDPHQWAIVDNKLYVNNNAFAMRLWDKDRPENIAAGQQNWPLLKKSQVAAKVADSK
jgi:YHS domain-containing protein